MYESPEIFEIGQAAELTLGQPAKAVVDACDCTKDKAPSPEEPVQW